MDKKVEEAKNKAIKVLDGVSTKNGLYASGGKDGYTSVWARDSMISLITATANTNEFMKVYEASLKTLATHQSHNGQIPNDVDVFEKRKLVTFATIDSSLWFVLGEYFYKKSFGDTLWEKHHDHIHDAMIWVSFQDAGEDLMPEQLPTSDWQDCFPHKYGHTINTQALYYAGLKTLGKNGLTKKLKKQVNKYLWSEKLGYYLPWHWKDHEKYHEKEEWFDSLGNLLAIIFDLASDEQANKILNYIKRKKIAEPYPIRAIYPPIKKGSKEWHDYFNASMAGTANDYLNGGIWPFIGGFYVCALVHSKRFKEAEKALENLAEGNSLGKGKNASWDFNEWIHPVLKSAEGGRHQSWSAGGYLLAYEAVKSKKNPLKI